MLVVATAAVSSSGFCSVDAAAAVAGAGAVAVVAVVASLCPACCVLLIAIVPQGGGMRKPFIVFEFEASAWAGRGRQIDGATHKDRCRTKDDARKWS